MKNLIIKLVSAKINFYKIIKKKDKDIDRLLYICLLSFIYHILQNLPYPIYHIINSNHQIFCIIMITISMIPSITFITIVYKYFFLNPVYINQDLVHSD